MHSSEDDLLRRLTRELEEETLLHEASAQLHQEAEARAARRAVELAQQRRDNSAAQVAALLTSADAWARRSALRDAGLLDGRERFQPLGSSLVRVVFRLALTVTSIVTFFTERTPLALVPLAVLWVAALLPERP